MCEAAASFVASMPPMTAAERKEPKDRSECFGILPSSLRINALTLFFILGSIVAIAKPYYKNLLLLQSKKTFLCCSLKISLSNTWSNMPMSILQRLSGTLEIIVPVSA